MKRLHIPAPNLVMIINASHEPMPRGVWVERIAENFIVVVCIYVVEQGILYSVSSTALVCVVFSALVVGSSI